MISGVTSQSHTTCDDTRTRVQCIYEPSPGAGADSSQKATVRVETISWKVVNIRTVIHTNCHIAYDTQGLGGGEIPTDGCDGIFGVTEATRLSAASGRRCTNRPGQISKDPPWIPRQQLIIYSFQIFSVRRQVAISFVPWVRKENRKQQTHKLFANRLRSQSSIRTSLGKKNQGHPIVIRTGGGNQQQPDRRSANTI